KTSARSPNLREASAISALFFAASAEIVAVEVCCLMSFKVPRAIQAVTIPTITKAQFDQNGSVHAGILQDPSVCPCCCGGGGGAIDDGGTLLASSFFAGWVPLVWTQTAQLQPLRSIRRLEV